jgi:hypothetical protein
MFNILDIFSFSICSARAGWVPEKKHVSPQLMDKYKMVYGLSITEMEIVQGAFKFKNNPNGQKVIISAIHNNHISFKTSQVLMNVVHL